MKAKIMQLAASAIAFALAAGCSSGGTPSTAPTSLARTPIQSPASTLKDYLESHLPTDTTSHVQSTMSSSGTADISTDLYLGSPSAGQICTTAIGFLGAGADASISTSSASPFSDLGGVSVYGRGGKLLALSNGSHCGLNLPIKMAKALFSLCGAVKSQTRLDHKIGNLANAGNTAEAIVVAHQLLSLSGTFSKDATVFSQSGVTPVARELRAMAAGNSEEWQGLLSGSRPKFNAGFHTYLHALDALAKDAPPCK